MYSKVVGNALYVGEKNEISQLWCFILIGNKQSAKINMKF